MKKRSFQSRRFIRDVMIVAFAFSVLLIGVVAYFTLQVKHDVSERYIYGATALAAERLSSIKDSIEASLEEVRKYGESGVVSLSEPDTLRNLLLPKVEDRLLSGISIADADGRSYFIQPNGSERKPSEADGFDPRDRRWYKGALETEGTYWTEQYRFHTLQQEGITAAVAYAPPKGKGRSVVAFDILHADLYRELKEMAPSTNSELFTFHRAGGADPSRFILVDPEASPLIQKAFSLWPGESVSGREVISFLHEGKMWWCGFQDLEIGREGGWIGVVMPESDIDGDVSRRRIFLWGYGLISIVLSLGLAFWLSRRYGRSSAVFDDTESGLLSLIAKGENRYVEFKSTLRMNLHSKKPGKEIEMAWLKGVAAFLNTDGGTLLLGVTDDGEITGLEQDVFENEDKCRLHFKNLIATHIGAEMSKHIRFVLVAVAGKTVGIVHCSRTRSPVFLKNGNKEAFYIRNGPSSDELPVSKALKYIKQRK